MTLFNLKKELQFFYPAYLLESFFSYNTRRFIFRILLILLSIAFILASGVFNAPTKGLSIAFFIILLISIKCFVLNAFFFSYRFHPRSKGYMYELAHIVFSSKESDLILGFIVSTFGYRALIRAGITDEAIDTFLQKRKTYLSAKDIVLDNSQYARSYIQEILKSNSEFNTFLLSHGVTEDIVWGSFVFASDLEKKAAQSDMWWSKEYLNTIDPLGRSWAYGEAYLLKKYSSPLRYERNQEHELHTKEIDTLELLLSKQVGGNVLIVGNEGSGKMEIIEGLKRKTLRNNRDSLRDIEYIVLSIDTLLATSSDNAEFEQIIITILRELNRSGNMVCVIPDLPELIRGASHIGVDMMSILTPYLTANTIRIIAISNTQEFHTELEQNTDLLKHFEILSIPEGSLEEISTVLFDTVRDIEASIGVFFTYGAVLEALSSAQRYFVDMPMFDTASDFLYTAAEQAQSNDGRIEREDILELVKNKTGIATGVIHDSEKKKLLELESLLHTRVIGQEVAISAISDALRRARSGINNPNRPIGSFLFLGPTGVGKTETTKALAEIFFGQQSHVLRLDMSEYNTSDAINRLIGGFNSDTPGVLSTMIRDHKYGVLLLDEFEKTDRKVLDLFLQILDEGIFSDSFGRKVSARNLIIIATSNAGSDYIFDAVKSGRDIAVEKDTIIDTIIDEGIFKPELINRFDGVVLFSPLQKQELKEIAKLMLERLVWKMKEKGITFVVNDALLDFLVGFSNDPKFGARPLRRVIQDTVEERIAEGILRGEYLAGSTIEFHAEDLKK